MSVARSKARVVPTTCRCGNAIGHVLVASERNHDRRGPDAGDFNMCMKCGELYVFIASRDAEGLVLELVQTSIEALPSDMDPRLKNHIRDAQRQCRAGAPS